VPRLSEGQNREKDKSQKEQTKPKADFFVEGASDVEAQNDADDNIHDGDKEKDHPPARTLGCLDVEINIVEWDERPPARQASLLKDPPPDNQIKNTNDEAKKRWAPTKTLIRKIVVKDRIHKTPFKKFKEILDRNRKKATEYLFEEFL
jgi:hypothetical protein